MIGGGQLTIMDRGGGRERIIPHAGARLSWVSSQAGSFSALIPMAIARAYGLIGGKPAGTVWIRYEHPCLPDWGGVVTAPSWNGGMLEIGAESFEVLFRKRRVPRVYGQQSAAPGALALRAFRDVQADDYTFIRDFKADEYGDPLTYEWRGGDLHDDVLRTLADSSGQEWWVDADRYAQWRLRRGTDLTGMVMLYHPHEIVDYRYVTDLWTVANDIEGVATDARYERSVNAIRDHSDSVKKLGRYQVSRRYERVVKGGTLNRRTQRDVEASAWPAEVMELTTVNVGSCWSRYDVGDSIGVTIPEAGVVRRVRIGARAIDVDSGTETLGVQVEHEADGW